MADWVWQASDLATGAPLGALTVTSWEHTDRLNTAETFSATLGSMGADMDRAAIDATLAARSVVVPFRNKLPLGYAGIVWAPNPPSFSGASLLSYFDRQPYDLTNTWTNVDQHTMMVNLVAWVQANGGNIQIDTSQVGLSGVLRTQTWTQSEQKNIGEALRQKADNINGFDFDFRVELDEAGNQIRRMRMWTPRRGRPYTEQNSPVFTVGRNARTVPAATANGAAMVTHVTALGDELSAGPPPVRRIARSVRADLVLAGYPRLGEVLDRSDIKNDTSLQQAADGWAYYHGAAKIDEIVLDVDPDDDTWPWGSWDLGDDCMVRIPTDRDPWWPTGLTAVRRIVAHRWRKSAKEERLEVVTGRPLQ